MRSGVSCRSPSPSKSSPLYPASPSGLSTASSPCSPVSPSSESKPSCGSKIRLAPKTSKSPTKSAEIGLSHPRPDDDLSARKQKEQKEQKKEKHSGFFLFKRPSRRSHLLSAEMGGCFARGVPPSNQSPIDRAASSSISPQHKAMDNNNVESSKCDDLKKGSSSASSSPSGNAKMTESTTTSSPQEKAYLKNRERRRLSLSQSDPVVESTVNTEKRGQLLTQSEALLSPKAEKSAALTELKSEEAEGLSENEKSISSEEQKVPKRRECRRLSVSGMPSSIKQDNFENKHQEVKSDTGFFEPSTLLQWGIGYACRKGLKPESPNQDDFFIVRIDDWGLYGVFDGHGPYGHDVSNFVQRELPKLIYNDPNFLTNPLEALRQSFVTVHQMLEFTAAAHNVFDCSLSGSTATVVLHRKSCKKLYVAHVGDSRCILGQLGENGQTFKHLDMTNDHKPNCEAEQQRIVASGGQVRRLEGDIPYRVFLKGKLYPGLAMSRAIGDTIGVQAGVICDPDVAEFTIDEGRDLFIVLCSDGVWEFLSSAEVADFVFRNGIRGVQKSADLIAKESWNRWIEMERTVVDDITAEVIYLNPELHHRM